MELGTIERLIEITAEEHDLTYEQITSKRRLRDIVLARHTAVYLIKQYWEDITYKKMGSYFGKKDHSTMIHSLKQYDLEVERGCINLYSVTNIIAKFEDEQEEKVAA